MSEQAALAAEGVVASDLRWSDGVGLIAELDLCFRFLDHLQAVSVFVVKDVYEYRGQVLILFTNGDPNLANASRDEGAAGMELIGEPLRGDTDEFGGV